MIGEIYLDCISQSLRNHSTSPTSPTSPTMSSWMETSSLRLCWAISSQQSHHHPGAVITGLVRMRNLSHASHLKGRIKLLRVFIDVDPLIHTYVHVHISVYRQYLKWLGKPGVPPSRDNQEGHKILRHFENYKPTLIPHQTACLKCLCVVRDVESVLLWGTHAG